MKISRAVSVPISVHAALKSAVHGVGEDYLAKSTNEDQLIRNADVALIAGILYAKLTLTGSLRNVDIHTAADIAITKLDSAVCSETAADNIADAVIATYPGVMSDTWKKYIMVYGL